MGRLFVGCSGWNYPKPADKGGWIGPFYPDTKTRFLQFYSKYFTTAEIDSTFHDELYSKMTMGTFIGIGKATASRDFQFSVKVPKRITHVKRLHQDCYTEFQEFLGKIGPLKRMKKLGTILFLLAPDFTTGELANLVNFLERLPSGYKYAVEFRHKSWKDENLKALLKHYNNNKNNNIAQVMTDSPDPDLKFLSNFAVTADHAFVRMHGRNKSWYNYLYNDSELRPWARKADKLRKATETAYVYFNNDYGAKAVYNALRFREMVGEELGSPEKSMIEKLREHFFSKKMILRM